MRKLKTPKSAIPRGVREDDIFADDLLRPEPKVENTESNQGGLALLGLTFAAFALIAIYISTPVDSPEWPDCPIQALGTCGAK